MSDTLLRKFQEERDTLSELVSNTLGRADSEQRDLVDAEMETLNTAKSRMTEIDRQIDGIASIVEARNAAKPIDHLLARRDMEPKANFQVNEPDRGLGSWVDSQQYRSWVDDGARGKSNRFSLPVNPSMATRATLVESTPIGSYLLPNKQKLVLPQGDATWPLIEAIGRLQISGTSVDMVTYGDPYGATGFQVVPELQKKPEAALKATTVSVSVETVAAYVKASRQLLADAPAARGFIETQLRRGFRTKVEQDVVAAVGAATFVATTGIAGQSLLEVARIGMATVAAAGFQPNALVVNPTDAASFDLQLMANTNMGAALGMGVWGLQVIPVPGIQHAYVGDFRTGVTLIERSGVDIFVTDSDVDDFVHNIITVLCEGRYKAVVTNPGAITQLAVTP